MKNRKKSPIRCIVLGAILLLCVKTEAQVNAQNDWFSVLESSCSNYLDVVANENVDSASMQPFTFPIPPQHGNVSSNGHYVSYCPDAGYLGADNFTYSVVSATGTASATVYINVLAHNNYIFAGDADQNGKVENFDVLAVGLAYDLKGPSRFNANSANALAWDPSIYLNTNPGAADCNGDGIVNSDDIQPIQDAYHDTFPIPQYFAIDTSVCRNSALPFFINPAANMVQDGDNLTVSFDLGNIVSSEAYGIAFTLEFDTRFISGSSIQFFRDNTWLDSTNQALFFNRSFQNTGEIEIALSRTDHVPGSGQGPVLRARLPINDNIDGIIESPGAHSLYLMLKKVRLINPYNMVQDVCLQQQPAIVYYKNPAGITETHLNPVKIYPNPTNNMLFVEAENIREIEITDITGRKIYSRQTDATDKLTIDLQQFALASGTFWVKVKTATQVSTQKIVIQH